MFSFFVYKLKNGIESSEIFKFQEGFFKTYARLSKIRIETNIVKAVNILLSLRDNSSISLTKSTFNLYCARDIKREKKVFRHGTCKVDLIRYEQSLTDDL